MNAGMEREWFAAAHTATRAGRSPTDRISDARTGT